MDRAYVNKKIFENATLIGPAQKHRRALCNSYISQAAVDMQRIDVMFKDCSHNDQSLSIS
jgi:hypothetical protein